MDYEQDKKKEKKGKGTDLREDVDSSLRESVKESEAPCILPEGDFVTGGQQTMTNGKDGSGNKQDENENKVDPNLRDEVKRGTDTDKKR
jgi:hypothetical protein